MSELTITQAAKVFDFIIPDWIDDSFVVGKICGTTIHAGEIRRLRAAVEGWRPWSDTEPNYADNFILDMLKSRRLIEAIRYRRQLTGEHLKEAKDYVEAIGERRGLRRRDTSTPYGGWEWCDGKA